MKKEFLNFVSKENLIRPGERTLLAVSGGVDSVVLCELFSQVRLTFAIAHCNFKLRTKESDADENFVAELADRYKVPFHSISFDTNATAKRLKLSIQEAARKLRYDWFGEIRLEFGYDSIATAHHKDDAVETFLINIIRGTGISGMHGILPKNGHVIRPILFAGKKEVRAFAAKQQLQWREDSSNASEKYLRNSIRLQVLPMLEKLNPDILNTLYRETLVLREVETIYKKTLNREINKIKKKNGSGFSINTGLLQKSEYPGTLLFEALKEFGFNAKDIENMLRASGSNETKKFMAEGWQLILERGSMEIIPEGKAEPMHHSYLVRRTTRQLDADGTLFTFRSTTDTTVVRDRKFAALDMEKLKFPLMIRHWKEGDRFRPLGMKGTQLVSDFFTDRKYSSRKKKEAWLLVSGNEIVWIAGERIDDRYKISGSTGKVFLAGIV